MSLFSCLEQVHPSPHEFFMADGLFNTLVSMLLFATFLIALASPLLRSAYRRRVTRLMGLDQVQPRPPSWWQAYEQAALNQGSVPGSNGSQPGDRDPLMLARGCENRLALASVCAWLAYVLAALPVSGWSDPLGSWLAPPEFAWVAGLLALGPLIVNLPVRWKRTVLIIGLVVAAVAAGVLEWLDLEVPGSEVDDADEPESLWVIGVGVILIFGVYLSLFHRRLRGLVVPLSLVMAVMVMTLLVPYILVEGHLGTCLWDLSAKQPVLDDPQSREFWKQVFSIAGISLAVLGLWLGLLVIGILARQVERGRLSDLSMVSLIGWGVISFTLILAKIPEESAGYSIWVAWLPLVWLVAPVVVYMIVLGRRNECQPGRDLLMLRVFSRHSKEQKLLDEVQSRWRYIGALQQAGGPDLVDINVSPYECAMFLSSRLHDLYLPAAVSADQLRGRFNYLPDREGRYRINEMFNFNTAWRNNVEQLILMSKTILLDLRGLTAEREGTSYEIGLLAQHGLLSRVVAVGDDKTDWAHVDHQLRSASASLEQLKRVEITAKPDVDALIAELLDVAVTQTPKPASQPDKPSHDHTV